MVRWTSLPLLLQLKITITLLLSLISQTQTMPDQRDAHTRHESDGDKEFSFWNSSNTISSEDDYDQLGGNEASLNSQTVFGEKSNGKNLKVEYSPFLPRSHRCSSLSDTSRSKAIAEGRKELMEMVQGMPESSFELSFQDMVVNEEKALHPQPHQDETRVDNKLMQSSSSSKAQTKRPNKVQKSKSNKPGQIMRVESMDSESFLLKLFFPASLKKVKVQNGSKVSPRPSLKESVKQGKDWSIKSSSSNDRSRYFDHNISFSHGCWPFHHYTKAIKKKVGG